MLQSMEISKILLRISLNIAREKKDLATNANEVAQDVKPELQTVFAANCQDYQ